MAKIENEKYEDSKVFRIRHSLAHIMAQAVQHLYPGAKLGIGPAIENGFYYDFVFEEPISEEILETIENEMRLIIKKNYEFERTVMSKDDALEFLFKNNQPFKAELAAELGEAGEELSFYTDGDFQDLCKGPHVGTTHEISPDAFKLMSVAGAYWRGDEKRPMMQRIYGIAFETKDELDAFLAMQEEAKKRDHRKLGKQLDLFTFSQLVGSGLPLFTPRGTFLREELNRYSQKLREDEGFEKVWIPHITKNDLYKTSGHWDKFGDELFLVKSQETDDELVMKPMNCPHHQQIFASQMRSYKDLPIKYLETTSVYRDEKAGELGGLSRVRAITQDDSHIFCTIDQIDDIYSMLIDIVSKFYGKIGMTFRARLSFHDPENREKYHGEDADWEKAEGILEKLAKEHELDYYIGVGEAAFYGPKIDFMVKDALGREHQLATPQLDFVQPKRFGLKYTDKDGTEKTPVMIHFALMGSLERFLSVYIEHTAGNFPLWLSYTQAVIIPISTEKHEDHARKIAKDLKSMGLRVEVDADNETLGNKIRKHQMQKVPYMLVIGDKEMETETVAVRQRSGANLGMMKAEEIGERMKKEIEDKI
jgi:threonyl-tRNA synthetase